MNTKFSFSLHVNSLCLVFLLFSCNKDDSLSQMQIKQPGDSPLMMAAGNVPLEGDDGTGPHAPPPSHCNCELQIVDATSPVPAGGSGGVLGYEFVVEYFPTGQSCYVFGAWATDCFDSYPGVDPTCMYQVPTGNNPTYPTGFYAFNYEVPAFQSYDIQVGTVQWFNSGGCTANINDNDDGKVTVRLRCCDGPQSECRQCYYSENIEIGINTLAQGTNGDTTTISLAGTCGCEPGE